MIHNNALRALMSEYRRASVDFIVVLKSVSKQEFSFPKDTTTKDPDCLSIQSIVKHVISSGYTYANYINEIALNQTKTKVQVNANEVSSSTIELEKMLDFTESVLIPLGNQSEAQIISHSIQSRWGTTYDVEQLLEHAIVHILRHRLQIERFLHQV